MKKLNVIIAFIMLMSFGVNATNEVTISGASGIDDETGYTTLAAAFAAITGKRTLQSGRDIEVKINGSTTETESASLVAGNWNSIKIYPTASGLSVSGDVANSLITFNGGSNTTIDGRVDATGSTKDLIITNINTTAGSTSTIRLYGTASNNTIKYCKIKGSQTNAYSGVIWISTASASAGNNNNIFEYNDITSANDANRPYNAVFAYGTSGFENDGNIIRNNDFYNFLNTGASSNGIFIYANNKNWTISGNSFYEQSTFTATSTATYNILYLNQSTITGFEIKDNFIGGQAAECGGSAFTKNGNNNVFNAIYVGVGDCSIQNNTIQNITWTNTSSAQWAGINITTGDITVGTTTGNTIGKSTGTGSIIVTGGATNSNVYGIFVNSGGTTNIQNNSIASVEATNSTGTFATNLFGIHKTGAGAINISANTIGNSTANSFITSSVSTANAQSIIAINNIGTGDVTINNNNIANITNSCSNTTTNAYSYVNGIRSTNATMVVTNNSISNLTAACANTAGYTYSSNIGVMLSGSTYSNTISGNTIKNLQNTYTNFAGNIAGIYMGGGIAFTNTINKNFIYNITAPNTNGAGAKIYGIWLYSGLVSASNNIISLAGDQVVNLYGIYDLGNVDNNVNLYYNTVSIGGSLSSGTLQSFGLYNHSANNTRDYRNNILINTRSTTGGSNLHYAIRLPNTTEPPSLDYNNYYVNGTGAVLGYASGNVTSLPIITDYDANSTNIDPAFVNASGSVATDFIVGTALTGAVIAGVTTDYSGATRISTQMGAWELPNWNGTAWSYTPTSVTDVIVNGNFSGAGFSAKNLIVNAGKQVSVTSGTLSAAGDFTLKSDAANGTATFIDNGGTLTVSGASKVEQYVTAGRNWYISSPLSGDNSSVFDAAGTNKMYSYAESTKSWVETSDNSTSLADMTGYVSNLGNTGIITFTGGNLNTGAQSVSNLSYTSGDKAGFHLLGNPYPSYLDWTGASRINVESTMWYRTKNSSSTYVFDTYNGVGTNNNESGAVTANIPPMQAFWVRVTETGNGSISFGNEDRNHRDINTNNFRAPAAKQSERKVLRLRVSNGSNSDETILLFNPSAQNSYDSFDSFKMTNNNAEIPELYTKVEDNELVINGMANFQFDTPYTVGFRPGKAASFSIKANELTNFDADTRIWLVDNLEGVEMDMTEGTTYNFISDKTTTETRFNLVFRAPSITTKLSDVNEKSIVVFQNAPNQITVNCKTILNENSKVVIYNHMGQKLITKQLTSNKMVIDLAFSAGVYIVAVYNANGKTTTNKIIIN